MSVCSPSTPSPPQGPHTLARTQRATNTNTNTHTHTHIHTHTHTRARTQGNVEMVQAFADVGLLSLDAVPALQANAAPTTWLQVMAELLGTKADVEYAVFFLFS